MLHASAAVPAHFSRLPASRRASTAAPGHTILTLAVHNVFHAALAPSRTLQDKLRALFARLDRSIQKTAQAAAPIASCAIQDPLAQLLAKQCALPAPPAATASPLHQQLAFCVVLGRTIRTTARTAAGLACCAHLAAMPLRLVKLHAPSVQQERTIQQRRQSAAARALGATQARSTPAAARRLVGPAILEPTAPTPG